MARSTINCAAFSTSTAGTTTDLTISGQGTVNAAVVILSLGVTDGTAVTDSMISIGIYVPGKARSMTIYSQSGQSGSNTWEIRHGSNLLMVLNGSGTIVRSCTVSAITDGIRLTWDGTPATAWRIRALFFCGPSTAGEITDFTGAPTVGTRKITTSFNADCEIFLVGGNFNQSAAAAGAPFGLGFACRYPSITNGGIYWNDPDAQSTTAPTCVASGSWFWTDGGNDNQRVVAWDDSSFTIQDDLGNSGALNGTALSIRHPGIRSWCGTGSTPTATGVAHHTESNLKLQAMLCAFTGCTANDTQQTDDGASSFGVSMVGQDGTSGVALARERDAQTTSACGSLAAVQLARCLTGTGGNLFLGTWNSAWPSIGVDINYLGANATARQFPYIAFGAEGVSLPIPRKQGRAHRALVCR